SDLRGPCVRAQGVCRRAGGSRAVRRESDRVNRALSKNQIVMKLEISVSAVARRFSEVLNRVQYRNETFVVTRRGKPVCEIFPVRPVAFTGRDLVRLLRSLPPPDKEYLDAVEDPVRNQPPAERSRWPR